MTLQIDSFGEIIHPSIIDTMKGSVSDVIGLIKEEDGVDENKPPAWVAFVDRELTMPLKDNEAYNFQRKIDFIMDSFSLFSQFRPRELVGDLIVVATLLDKVPNFGHLTRTCEIFGVKELVVPNKKILDDDQFLAISVSAEKHLPILDVREEYLANFLLLKKSQGYQVVFNVVVVFRLVDRVGADESEQEHRGVQISGEVRAGAGEGEDGDPAEVHRADGLVRGDPAVRGDQVAERAHLGVDLRVGVREADDLTLIV